MSDCARCEAHERRFEQVMVDVQNAQADVIAKNRIITALKQELARLREEEPDAPKVKRVLEHWRVKTNHPRARIPLTGARAKLVRSRLKEFTVDELCWAVNGAAAYPFTSPQGRVMFGQTQNRHDDLELICRDEKRVEDFIRLYHRHLREPFEWPDFYEPLGAVMVRLASYVRCPDCRDWRARGGQGELEKAA